MASDESITGSEAVFEMDPIPVLMTVARQVVNGQRTIAEYSRRIAAMSPEVRALPEAQEVVRGFGELKASWFGATMPSLVASMQLALEVHDTFGPGRTVIEDPFQAALWNNKYHAGATMLRSEEPGSAD